MAMTCDDRERIFLEGTAEEWAALQAHAAACAACREELTAWKNLSVAAAGMHQEWDSPELWPRIAKALAENAPANARASWWQRMIAGRGRWGFNALQWQTAAATLLLAVATASAVWMFYGHRDPHLESGALLKDNAVSDVERAERDYERAIDKLDAQARPQLAAGDSPLLASYREKLLVLDSAITDLRAQAGMNPANGHLRRQLLAMYREKQDTLEQILETKPR